MNLFLFEEPCPKCNAPARERCDDDCVLMQDPGAWVDDPVVSDADPGR